MVEIKSEINFSSKSILNPNENQKKTPSKLFEKKINQVPEEVILEFQNLLFYMSEIEQTKKKLSGNRSGDERNNEFRETKYINSHGSGVKSNVETQLLVEKIKVDNIDIVHIGDASDINVSQKNKVNTDTGDSQEFLSKQFIEKTNKLISNPKKDLNAKVDLISDFSSPLPSNRDFILSGNQKLSPLNKKELSQFELPVSTSSGSEQKSMIYGFRSWGSDHSVKISVDSEWLGNQVTMQPSSYLVEHRLAQHSDMSGKNSSALHQRSDQDEGKNENYFYPEDDEQ